MADTLAIETSPRVTSQQLERAIAVVQHTYDRLGVAVQVRTRHYEDPEMPGPPALLIEAMVGDRVSSDTFQSLIVDVPRALREAGLYEPVVPISTIPLRHW